MAELLNNVWVYPEGTLPVLLVKGTQDDHEHAHLVENQSVWSGQPNVTRPDVTHTELQSTTVQDEPARSGKGSGREKWAEFARSHGYFPHESEDRDDIIVALQTKGVIA